MRTRAAAILVLTALAATAANAADCSVRRGSFPSQTPYTHICVIPHGFPDPELLARAADLWNTGCNAGDFTPSICIGNIIAGCLQIDAYYVPGNSDLPDGSCREEPSRRRRQ